MRISPLLRRSVAAFLFVSASLLPLHAQSTLLASNNLPDAPSALLSTSASDPSPDPDPAPQFSTPSSASAAPMVNGRLYRKPSRHEDFIAYRREMIGPRPFISAAIRSAIEQARTVPTGWGQDFPGYMQRYGSAYGEAAIDSSVRYGIAAALHQDTRYLICHECSVGAKISNAILSEFTARQGEDGHRVFSPAPIVANFSGPLVAYNAWYPPGYTTEQALKHSAFGFSTRILFKIVREFLDDRDPPAGAKP